MRATSLFAGLAFLATACGGGEKKAEEQATPETPAAAETPAPAATGATHDVKMTFDGTSYKFEPAEITIKSGDVINYHNESGFPHNVSFWTDSIPAGAAPVLQAAMADQMAPLQSKMLTTAGEVYTVSFANAPAGEYKVYCLPHLAMGMKGKVTVQ